MTRSDASRGPVPSCALTMLTACGLAVAAGPFAMPALGQGPLSEPFPAVLLTAELDGEIGFVIEGVDSGDGFGLAVGGLGDFNGDGVGDVIIGAPKADPVGHPGGGEAYIVFGSAAGFPAVVRAADLDGSNGFVMEGARGTFDLGERAGSAVAGAGDLNGDGLGDAIIGANRAGVAGVFGSAGKAYVVFGGDGGFEPRTALADLSGADGFTMVGVDSSDTAGQSVASAGDTNGDGIDDAIVGVPGRGTGGYSGHYYRCCPGAGYVVYGRDVPGGASFPAEQPLASFPQDEGYAIDGDSFFGDAGWAVASAGDVNGDGFDDVLLSAPDVAIYYGACYVVFGKPTGDASSVPLRSLDGANGFRLTAPQTYMFNHIGRSVESAGDLNGDGIDDMMIGTYMGAVVVFGRDDGFPAEVDLGTLDGTDGVWLRSNFGSNDVAGLGDINGDGIDDVAVSDPSAHGPFGMRSGEIYVVYGSRDGFPATLHVTVLDGADGFRIQASVLGEGVGSSVSSAGDVNGDGVNDLLIGAVSLTSSSDPGRALVVYGRSAGCRVDLDGDGTLTIFDFLAFGNLFDLMDPAADFDGDGDFTIFDFLAFQNAFDAGCP